MLSYFIQSFPFRITVVFEKSGFTHSKNTNHINQLAEFTLYLQGLMTDRKVPHISENQRHEEDNAKSSYVPSPSCQTFSWFKPPLVLFPLSLHDASPSPSYHHSFPPSPIQHTHYQATMSLTRSGIGRSRRRVPRIAPAPSDQWDFLLLLWQHSCNDKITHYSSNGRFSGREWGITLGGGRGGHPGIYILTRDTCGWKVNLLLL